jgi:hypothetical protein
MVRQGVALLESVTGEMEAYWTERSEQWRESERGEGFAQRMEQIGEIVASMRELEQ